MEVYKENLGGRTNYNIFVPENVNQDTPVLFYTINLVFTEEMKEDILKENGDAIIIVPENSPVVVGSETGGHKFQTEAIEAFNLVKEKYNLQTNQFSQAGFSSGYGPSIRTMADYIKNNPNAERQILISVDGCESTNGFTVYDSEYAALKENNTIIISYSQKYRQNSEINFLKKSGLPILFVVDPDPELQKKYNERTWGRNHGTIANNFTERGLYESLLNFAQGKGELPDGYTYQLYDPKTKKTRTIDASEAANYLGIIPIFEYKLQKLLSLNTISLENLSISTNTDILKQPFNEIISKIKNTSSLQSSSQSVTSFASTTKLPSQIPEIITSHFEATVELLYKLANNMTEFAKIGPLIDKIDRSMADDALKLLEQQNATESVQPVNLSSTNQNNSTDSEIKTINTELKANESETTKDSGIDTTIFPSSSKVLDNGTPINIGTAAALSGIFSGIKNDSKNQNLTSQNVTNTENNKLTEDQETTNNESSEEENKTTNENKETSTSQVTSNKTQNVNTNISNTETKVPTENVITNNQTSEDSTSSTNIQSTNQVVSNISRESSSNEINPLDEFPKYEEIYSDESRIVYNHNDEYKIVVHKDGNQIIGIEHYYDFKDEQTAISALENLKSEYTNTEHMENIMQQGRYVKVVFNEDMYENLNITQIKEKYSELNEIVKI